LLKTHKNKKKNKFIVSERQYIGITATIYGFRSTLASCEAREVQRKERDGGVTREGRGGMARFCMGSTTKGNAARQQVI